MFEALSLQQRSENHQEDKISADEKMKVALELKGLSDEEISERVKALIQLSDDGVWMCKKCKRFVGFLNNYFIIFSPNPHDLLNFLGGLMESQNEHCIPTSVSDIFTCVISNAKSKSHIHSAVEIKSRFD